MTSVYTVDRFCPAHMCVQHRAETDTDTTLPMLRRTTLITIGCIYMPCVQAMRPNNLQPLCMAV